MVANGRLTAECLSLECQLVTLDPEAPEGVIRPLPVADSGFLLEADTVIAAIGQDPDLAPFTAALEVGNGLVVVDADALATSQSDVFAGGDVAGLSRFVSVAIGEGRRAAYGIAASLGHPDVAPLPRLDIAQAVGPTEINTYYFPPVERAERERLAVDERVQDFREVTQGYAVEQAAQEAGRCMSCGTCIECDNCFIFCPDMAIKRAGDSPTAADDPVGSADDVAGGAPHYLVLDQYCKGCGLCVTECPRGAVNLQEEVR
jgi:Pyruvate/2-oxoacid:ferredoxin oxidoreductase delta subunit